MPALATGIALCMFRLFRAHGETGWGARSSGMTWLSSGAGAAMVAPELSVCGLPSESATAAPASRAIRTPAQTSQGVFPRVMLASRRLSATQARSSAAVRRYIGAAVDAPPGSRKATFKVIAQLIVRDLAQADSSASGEQP